MNPGDARLEERLTEVEIKLAFTEDLLDRLDAVIVRQQAQIDGLVRELLQLREQVPDREDAAPRNLRDEKPPHY